MIGRVPAASGSMLSTDLMNEGRETSCINVKSSLAVLSNCFIPLLGRRGNRAAPAPWSIVLSQVQPLPKCVQVDRGATNPGAISLLAFKTHQN